MKVRSKLIRPLETRTRSPTSITRASLRQSLEGLDRKQIHEPFVGPVSSRAGCRADTGRAKFLLMRAQRSLVSAVTALVFFAQATGLAYAVPPQGEAQPVPYAAGQRLFSEGRASTTGLPPGTRGSSAFVHVTADEGIVLESLVPGSGRWDLVCMAPCDVELPLANQYRIGGPNIRTSSPFGVSASPGQRVLITVAPASKAGFTGGVTLLSTGGAATGIGLVVLLLGAIGMCTENKDDPKELGCAHRTSSEGLEIAGAVITFVGVGLIVGGAILFASNSRTREKQAIAALAPPARPDTAWLRAPMWHDSVPEAPGPPKEMGFPIFTRSF